MKTFRTILVVVLVTVFGVCLAVAAVTVFGPLFETHSERSETLNGLKAENDRTEREIAELRRKQNEFDTNPEYVELTARMEGRVKANETVFDFGESAGETQTQP